jgi:hypothetical protein
MENSDWRPRDKPFDLRERLLIYACLIVRVVQYLHRQGPIAVALSYQLLKSGTSAGANYEEADDGSSGRDKLAKKDRAPRAQGIGVPIASAPPHWLPPRRARPRTGRDDRAHQDRSFPDPQVSGLIGVGSW